MAPKAPAAGRGRHLRELQALKGFSKRMDSTYLQNQLDAKRREHEATLKQLENSEKRIRALEEAAQAAYQEVGEMQTELQNEQRCLETAVRVASRLYSRNTELKKRTTQRRTPAESQRRKLWKEKFEKEALHPVSESPQNVTSEDFEGNAGEEEEEGDAYDDIEEIVELDKKTKSDLEKALNEGNSLRRTNRDISTKLSKLEAERREYETTITQLQAVVKMKDEELGALREKFDVESQVRQRAETYAAKMYGKNKAFQRKSVMLKSRESGSFEEKLENTMKDLERLTQELEEEKMVHRQEVQKLEDQLQYTMSPEASKVLENKISLLTIEIQQLKASNKELTERNSSLESKINGQSDSVNLGPIPPPPPPPPIAPPPPPPPPASKKADPAESIYVLIAERKANKTDPSSRSPKKSSTLPAANGYADAMDEMMRRIKSGVALKKSTNPSQQQQDTCDQDAADRSHDELYVDSDYDEIYSQAGSASRRLNITEKSATIGGHGDQQRTQFPKPGGAFNRTPLKPAKKSDLSTAYAVDQQTSKDFEARQDPFSRNTVYQDSVKLPKDINPDLKKILEKRRIGMKKAQSGEGNV